MLAINLLLNWQVNDVIMDNIYDEMGVHVMQVHFKENVWIMIVIRGCP